MSVGLKNYFLSVVYIMIVFVGCEDKVEKSKDEYQLLISEIESKDLKNPKVLPLIDSLKVLAEKKKSSEGKAKAISFLGLHYYQNKNFLNAIDLFQTASQINIVNNDKKELGDNYDNIAKAYNNLKMIDSSIFFFKKAYEIKINLNDSTGAGKCLNNIGFVFWQNSEYDSAIIYFEQALEIREKVGDKEYLASTLNNIGTVYYQWSIYDRALEYYFRALEYSTELNNYSSIALIKTNIGIIYKETGSRIEALNYFNESLKFARMGDDSTALAYALSSIASHYLDENNDSSLYYYRQSYEIYKKVNSPGGMILALTGIGENYLRMNRLYDARSIFNYVLLVATEDNIQLRVAEAHKYLGEVNLLEKKYAEAKKSFLRSIEISQALNIENYLKDNYLKLSQVEELLGNKNDALAALKKYEEVRAKVDDADMKKRMEDLQKRVRFERYSRELAVQKYENERQQLYLIIVSATLILFLLVVMLQLYSYFKQKKINTKLEAQNELIKRQSLELEKKNAELTELNKSKDKLFSIIAHDLKNPFFALINYAEFLNEDFDSMRDDEKLEMINRIKETSNATYQLLENLLNLSATRIGLMEFKPAPINLKEILDKVIPLFRISLTNKNIKLVNDVVSSHKVLADSQMIEIVFRNLLSNAIKYTPHDGEIIITSNTIKDCVQINIKDNGIGMDEETLSKLFSGYDVKSQKGTDGERGTGLGLGLCKEFVEKNGGKILVESKLAKGSEFIVQLPLAN